MGVEVGNCVKGLSFANTFMQSGHGNLRVYMDHGKLLFEVGPQNSIIISSK